MGHYKTLMLVAVAAVGSTGQLRSAVACSPTLTACGNTVYSPLAVSRASDGLLPPAVTASNFVASRCSETSRNIAMNIFATTTLGEAAGYEIKAKGPLPAGLTLPTTPINLAGDFWRVAYTGPEASLSFTLSIAAVEVDGDRGPSTDVQVDVAFPTYIDTPDRNPCGDVGCSSSGSAQWASLLGVAAMLATRRRRRA